MSGRVRNVSGRVQNQIAQGAAPPSAAVVGEYELNRWRALLDQEQEKTRQEDLEVRKLKHDVSQHRKEGWSNTVEGMHKAKEVARLKRLEEEEARRRLIDEEEENLRKAEKRAIVDNANRQLHARDQRVLTMNAQLLMHDVLQEREEQIALSARKKQLMKEREQEYAESIARAAEQERLEKQEAAIVAKQKLVALSQDRIKQLEEQKASRAQEFHSARAEGARLRQVADDDAKEAEEQKASARLKAREIAVEHQKQLKEKAARTPRRTEGVAVADNALEERNHAYLLKKAEQQQQYQDCLSARRGRKDVARQQALELYESPTRKKDRAVDQMMSARSMEGRMLEDDVRRSDFREQSRKQAADLDAQVTMKNQKTQRARNEQEKNIQARIAQQVASLEEEDRQAKLQAKQDALNLQKFHKLQAGQKKVNDAAFNNELMDEGKKMRSIEDEENQMFQSYVESMLPQNMNPKLRQTAIKPANKLVSA